MPLSAQHILPILSEAVSDIELSGYSLLHRGKVRNTYERNRQRIIVTTDRQSAFDRILAAVPFKGQVLNKISEYWFHATKDIIANHLIAVPDPAVMIVEPVEIFPVEFVIRGYLTGSTDTSVWKNYEKGVRKYCGVVLPEGMKKNESFMHPLITPTTKSDEHDELISPEDIVKRNLMSQDEWDFVAKKTMQIFLRGQQIAQKHGLILVDTKFEFGRSKRTGEILLADEVLTPDSSRYWLENSYTERLSQKKEPESFDKEFLRLWFVDHCDPYHDSILPDAPPELIARLAEKYIDAYEMVTGETFTPSLGGSARIQKNLDDYFAHAVR